MAEVFSYNRSYHLRHAIFSFLFYLLVLLSLSTPLAAMAYTVREKSPLNFVFMAGLTLFVLFTCLHLSLRTFHIIVKGTVRKATVTSAYETVRFDTGARPVGVVGHRINGMLGDIQLLGKNANFIPDRFIPPQRGEPFYILHSEKYPECFYIPIEQFPENPHERKIRNFISNAILVIAYLAFGIILWLLVTPSLFLGVSHSH